MTDTRRPAPAGAGRRVQPRLDESLTGSVSHEMSTSDLSAAMPGRHRIGTVAGFGLECWPTSRRNSGRLQIGMLADFVGIHSLALSLYFASQGAGQLAWPLLAGFIRLVIAVGGGWAVLTVTGSLTWTFATLGVALVAYGATLVSAITSGVWFRHGNTGDYQGTTTFRGGLVRP